MLFRTGRPANQQSISQPELNYAETFQQGGLDLSGYMNANNNTSALPLLAEAEPAEPPQAGHTVKAQQALMRKAPSLSFLNVLSSQERAHYLRPLTPNQPMLGVMR